MSELTIGQKLWWVGSNYRRHDHDQGEATVTKIGRKWAELSFSWRALRIDKNTLIADGGGYTSPGRCYLSRDHFEAAEHVRKVWDEFQTDFRGRYGMPPEMTVERIIEARRLLGLPASAIEAEGRDPQGHGAEHESATRAAGDAPTPPNREG